LGYVRAPAKASGLSTTLFIGGQSRRHCRKPRNMTSYPA
jgi:hypothetical protein